METEPIFDQLAAERLWPQSRRWNESDPEEVPVGRHGDHDDDGLADQADPDFIAPLKAEGEPMRYRRDAPRDDQVAIDTEAAHVRAHLSSVADADDDPDTNADDVIVSVLDHVDGDPALVSIIGELDMEPDAPYLRRGYDPDADDDGTRFARYSEEGRE